MRNAISMAVVLAAIVAQAVPYVTNVVAKQRYPWNGKVDITFALSEDCGQKG